MKAETAGAAIALLFAVLPARAGDWPAFRGPAGDGISAEPRAPSLWGPEKNVKWKAALPRPCNGSPIVSNGRVFAAGAEDADGLKRSLYCFDRKDGRRLWTRTVEVPAKMPTHETNPYCGSTPAADGRRVVVWHGAGGLHAYDFDGKPLWSRDLGEFRHMWGDGPSPLLHGNRVLLHAGPGKRVFLTAIDLDTGKTLWETEEPVEGDGDRRANGDPQGSWATPVLALVEGRAQVICPMPTRVVACDAETGKIVWWCEGLRHTRGDLAYSSPSIAGTLCVVTGGYGGPALAVRLGGTGDVTATHRVWRTEKNPQSVGSAVFAQGFLYRPNAGPGMIECLDPDTGRVLWKDRAAGSVYWSSVVFAAGRLYVTNQEGTTVVFKPNPERFELVATNRLEEPTNATPAVSEGEIFLRTHRTLYCIAEDN